ncbi:hypothetical protein CLOM_g19428, partial [Closterium sp. NIES-68]
NVLYTYV